MATSPSLKGRGSAPERLVQTNYRTGVCVANAQQGKHQVRPAHMVQDLLDFERVVLGLLDEGHRATQRGEVLAPTRSHARSMKKIKIFSQNHEEMSFR